MVVSNGLEGYLVGIGKVTSNGEFIYQQLDKPIHNRIVKNGFKALLTLNNETFSFTTAMAPVFSKYMFSAINGSTSRPGDDKFTPYDSSNDKDNAKYIYDNTTKYYSLTSLLSNLAVGDDGETTEFTDTTLHHMIGGYSSTNYNGNIGDFRLNTTIRRGNKIKIRVTKITNAINSTTQVKEIGLFKRLGQSVTSMPSYGYLELTNNYMMFSRIVLEDPFDINSGDKFVATYELNITVGEDNGATNETGMSSSKVKYINDLFGLKDINNDPLKAKCYHILNGTINSGSDNVTIPCRSSTGEWLLYTGTTVDIKRCYIQPVYALFDINAVCYKENGTWKIPTAGAMYRCGPYSYDDDKFNYRDGTFICNGSWPTNMTEDQYVDLQAISVNGVVYEFGYMEDVTNPDTGETTQQWHQQTFRKYGTKTFNLTFRQKWNTDDTVNLG